MSACVSQNDIRIISSDEGKKGGEAPWGRGPKAPAVPDSGESVL
ncbi:hypothetical protein N8996_06135 [Candidatus Poseidonia alphae]|nr:hypothetical protein [Candidatus Poseidonia alphae]